MALIQVEVDLANQSLGKIGASQTTLAKVTAGTGSEAIQVNLHYEQTRDSLLRTFEWPFAKTRLRLVSAWLTDTTYTTDQYVWQSSLLYKAASAHTSDVFATDLTAGKWTLVSTIDAWATLTVYAVGDLVTTNALLYKCLIAHTAGTFSTDLAAGKWILETTKPTNVFGFNYELPASSLRLATVNDDHILGTHRHHGHHDFDDWQLETNTILTDLTQVDIVYIDQIAVTTEWDELFVELFIARLAKKLLAPLAGSGSGTTALRQDLDTEIKELNKIARTVGRQEGNRSGRSNWVRARLHETGHSFHFRRT